MKDFFEGAKFGDKYIAADGGVLIYHCSKKGVATTETYHYLIKEEEEFEVRGRHCRHAAYNPYVSRGDCAVLALYQNLPIEQVVIGATIIRKCGEEQHNKDNTDNIFKNAKFGDKFVTRDGRIALFNRHKEGSIASLFLEGKGRLYNYHYDGLSYDDNKYDIVAKVI